MNTPFSNARIVPHDGDPSAYIAEPEPRGSAKLVLRAGILAEILRNAARWKDGYESPPSKAKEWGDLLDCAALTPHRWHKRFCILPEDAPRRPSDRQRNAKKPSPESVAAVKWWDDWNAQNGSKQVVTHEMNGSVMLAAGILRENKRILTMIESGPSQVWIQAEYTDQATGLTVPVKCCIDIMPDAEHPILGDALIDLKTASSVAPRPFARKVFDFNWDLQAAFELDIYNALGRDERTIFYHVAQENFAPYHCRAPQLGDDFVQRGRMRYQFALAIYCRALASGVWPGYDKADWPVTTPEPWMMDQADLYDELQEPAEEEQQPEETPVDLIP